MNMNNEMNSVIEIRCLAANTAENPHDEPAIQLSWDEYSCGLLILTNNVSVHLFAYSESMRAALLLYWSEIGMNEIAMEVYMEEGVAGLINICHFFLEKIANQIAEALDEIEATA